MKKYLYIMQCKEYIKVGVSNNPEDRLKTLQTGNPFRISLLVKVVYDDCYDIEHRIHKYYDDKRKTGEWFQITNEIKNFVKYLKNVEYETSTGCENETY